jgi:hypothetical protein
LCFRGIVSYASRMSEIPATAAAEDVSYTYRPSLLGAASQYTLSGEEIVWARGGRSGRVPFRNIRRLHMSYRPTSMQSHRFRTEIWAEGAPKLEIVSSSWKSMVEQERQDGPYKTFIAELHRRIGAAGAPVRFEQGTNPLLYWPGVIVFVGLSLGLAFLIVRALQSGSASGAVLIGAFLMLFLWQSGNFFRRNKPGLYRADAPPPALMPKG